MLIISEVLSLQMEKGLSVRQNMSISYIRDLLKRPQKMAQMMKNLSNLSICLNLLVYNLV